MLEVTNDYRALRGLHELEGPLGSTSCGRSVRLREVLSRGGVVSAEDAFALLADAKVQMEITVQHMVFHAASGLCEVRLPVA